MSSHDWIGRESHPVIEALSDHSGEIHTIQWSPSLDDKQP